MATDDVGPTERVRDHVRSVLQRRVERSMAPTMLPYAIETAARADHERVPILLYCPRERCWHTGVWWQGAWRLQGDVERVLHPTHWLPASTDVVVESGPVAPVVSTDVVVETDPVARVSGRRGPSGWPPS
jgi:hypothetical protein